MPALAFGIINLVLAVFFVYLAGRMAIERGRAAKPWMWGAAIFWPLAIPILASLPKRRVDSPAS
jgi:hypothetical protein